MSTEVQQVNNDQPLRPRRWVVVWYWGRRVLFWSLGLLLILMLLFQLPPIQRWVVQGISKTLTKELGSEVRVGHVYLAFFDRLTLKDFYVEDVSPGDTLLYSRSLKVNFVTNPFVLLWRGFTVEEIGLKNATLNLRRAPGARQTNLEILLGKLFPPKSPSDKPKRPFHLDIRRINLKEVAFAKDDQAQGQQLYAAIGQGNIRLRRLNLPQNTINVRSITLDRPALRINEFPGTPAPIETVLKEKNTSAARPLILDIETFKITGGQFALHNYDKEPVRLGPADELNYRHMEVFDIQMEVRCFSYHDGIFLGEIKKIALQDSSGFVLEDLHAREARVSAERTELIDFKLKTPYSELGDTLIFRHRELTDYADFPNAVRMEGHFNSATVALRDIITFAPGLKYNTFFANNRDEIIFINGNVRGSVNNLRGNDLNIQLSDGSSLRGSFSARDLAVKNEEWLNLRLQQLNTRVRTLQQLIPGMNLPSSFERLGRLNFKGEFIGFFADFVANGDLRTDIGRAVMDMRMNLKNGKGKANYSGRLRLIDFDLGKWMNNNDFGLVNFASEVKDGVGLTGQTASAQLIAEIQSFYFKKYNYQNARLSGQLNRNLFDGVFSIKDENVDFNFRGLLNFKDSVPVFNFKAEVKTLDLKKLNLLKKDLVLAGNADIDLSDSRLAKMAGRIKLNDLKIVQDHRRTHLIDSVLAVATFDTTRQKRFEVASDIFDMEVVGEFDITQIPDLIVGYFKRNYPAFWNRLGLKTKNKKPAPSDYTFDIRVKDTRGLMSIVGEQFGDLRDMRVYGYYKTAGDSLLVNMDLEAFTFANFKIEDAAFSFRDDVGGESDISLHINRPTLNDRPLNAIALIGLLRRDTLNFGVNYYASGFFDDLNLGGKFYPYDSSRFQIQLEPTNLVILRKLWQIDPDNFITFGKKYLSVQNFALRNEARQVRLESLNNQGARLTITNFDFSLIDEFWDYDPLNFSGSFDVMAEVGDLFEMKDLRAFIRSDSFYINGDPYGKLGLAATAKTLKNPLNTRLLIDNGWSKLRVDGFYNLAEIEPDAVRRPPSERANRYFDFNVEISKYPLCIAEYFIGEVISGANGDIDAKLRFHGLPSQPNINGEANLLNGSVTVNYLKTTYTFAKGKVDVNNFLFDATGITLRDKYNHAATVSGGIRHNRLRDFRLDARLRTQRFLALDTQKGDNKLFYGHALGRGEVRFSGPFNRIDIYINATAGDSTRIVIPISSEKEVSELQFVRFVNKREAAKKAEEAANPAIPTGVSLEMNLVILNEAQIELVFNEQTGDVIKGSGRGNIRVLTPRNGDFRMFGDYTIEQGDYLFTLYNVVNKKFVVRPGGYIQWTGDPFGAQINLEAEYKGLNTAIANFIQEYLVSNPQLKNDAGKSTPILLLMNLQGELMRPIINFDIQFPLLTGQLKAYAESKMTLLKRDQNELNRQVFGLIVVGQFLPENVALQGSTILYNTVSEFVSNQLSLLLTELFSEVIADGRVMSGIDLDIAYNQYQTVDLGTGQDFVRGDEFGVQLRQNFFNDRLSVLIGGNVDIGTNLRNAATAGTFIGNDVVIEYVISKDRSLKLRVYQRLQPDIGGQRLQVGTGLSFRKEFDSFGEFWRSLKKDAKAPAKDRQENQ